MPKLTTCALGDRVIDIGEALRIKETAPRRRSPADFRCGTCGEPVRPHRAGGHAEAHFEHLERNPACPNSDPARA